MKKIPELPPVKIDPLYEMTQGFQKCCLLFAAIEMQVFNSFIRPKTAKEIALEFETDIYLTEKFLNSLVTVCLLKKEGLFYDNTDLSRAYLKKDSPFYQGNIINLKRIMKSERWLKLFDILREGPYDSPNSDNSGKCFDKTFTLAMSEGAMRGTLYIIRDILAELPEFRKAKTLLDLGGGHGMYAIAFSQVNYNLKSYVLDFPAVIEVTKEIISEYGMNKRVKTISEDFVLNDDWGESSYDIIFSSDCLYYPEEQLLPILKKIKNNLINGGLFISKHWILDNDRTQPEAAVLWDLEVSLKKGMPLYTYSRQEFVTVLENSGFSNIKVADVSTTSRPATLFIAKYRRTRI